MTDAIAKAGARLRHWTSVSIAFVVVFTLTIGIVIAMDVHRGRAASDQDNYHLPMIRTFIEQWPDLDFRNYLSATTPGYHVVIAAVGKFVSTDLKVLQGAAACFSLALLAVLLYAARPKAEGGSGEWARLAAIFGAMSSIYVFPPGAWLLPDNLGWLLVLVVLLLSLHSKQTASRRLLTGVVLAALVSVRQIHLWAAAPWWIATMLQTSESSGGAGKTLRVKVDVLVIAATLPALAVVGFFFKLWGGLAPPAFQDGGGGSLVTGANGATPAFILAQVAVISIFFLPLLIPAALESHRRWNGVLVFAALAGLAGAAIPETTYSTDAGRYSGLWNLVKAAPVIAGRSSVIMLILAPIGAMALVAWGMLLTGRARMILGVALAAFVAAQSLSHNCWQRYHEPFLLMLLVLALTHAKTDSQDTSARRRMTAIGATAFAALCAGLTVLTLTTAKPAKVIDVPGVSAADSPGL